MEGCRLGSSTASSRRRERAARAPARATLHGPPPWMTARPRSGEVGSGGEQEEAKLLRHKVELLPVHVRGAAAPQGQVSGGHRRVRTERWKKISGGEKG
jgi:hypothetical protein